MYNTDIAMVSYRQFKRNCLVPSQNSLGIDVIERGTAIRELLLDEIVQNYVWNKLYRRKLFEGIRFPAGVIYDDINIMYDLIKKCNGIAYKDEAKYNYCLRETGIISTNSHKKREDAMRSIYKRYLFVESDFPSLKQYNAYSFTLWMIRLYVFTVIENDLDDDFLKIRRTLLQKIYDNNFTFIISKLKPKKRIVLLAMLLLLIF